MSNRSAPIDYNTSSLFFEKRNPGGKGHSLKENRYTDLIWRGFCSFFREGKEKLRCGTYRYLQSTYSSQQILSLIDGIVEGPDYSFDDSIRETVCREWCDFLIDGCDFRDAKDSPPCGGYMVIEHIMKHAKKKGGNMFVYLVRHGEPKSKDEDPSRPLSDKGIKDVKKIASALYDRGIKVGGIYHSGKERAQETAEIISERCIPAVPLREADGLHPNDDPAPWKEKIVSSDEDLMIVGHLPFLHSLGLMLLDGTSPMPEVNFLAGTVICLKKEEGGFSFQWALSPGDIS